MHNHDLSVANLHKHFHAFRQKLRHIWEEYSLIRHYAPFLHDAIKKGDIAPLAFSPFLNETGETIKKSRAQSMSILGQVKQNSISHRVLLDSIGAFEDLIGKVASAVYRDYPGKLIGSLDATETENIKLSRIIVSSVDREEIIERMIEERMRSIFYGNPVNIFSKDSIKLELGSLFSGRYGKLLDEYAEIVARRNIIVHNSGRVDRKYLREVSGSGYRIGNKIPTLDAYLRRALALLEGIAAVTAVAVIKNIYKGVIRGKLNESHKSFSLGLGK